METQAQNCSINVATPTVDPTEQEGVAHRVDREAPVQLAADIPEQAVIPAETEGSAHPAGMAEPAAMAATVAMDSVVKKTAVLEELALAGQAELDLAALEELDLAALEELDPAALEELDPAVQEELDPAVLVELAEPAEPAAAVVPTGNAFLRFLVPAIPLTSAVAVRASHAMSAPIQERRRVSRQEASPYRERVRGASTALAFPGRRVFEADARGFAVTPPIVLEGQG